MACFPSAKTERLTNQEQKNKVSNSISNKGDTSSKITCV